MIGACNAMFDPHVPQNLCLKAGGGFFAPYNNVIQNNLSKMDSQLILCYELICLSVDDLGDPLPCQKVGAS